MRILCSIVFSQALLMVAGKSEMSEGRAVGAQLVGRHPRRREALFAEQLPHQFDGRRPVSTTLDQDLEDLAIVVDGTPQIRYPARRVAVPLLHPKTIAMSCSAVCRSSPSSARSPANAA